MMENEENYIHIRCVVKHKIFFASDTGYSVFAAIREDNGQEMIVNGKSFEVVNGLLLDVKGCWQVHEKYGKQFAAVSWMEIRPESLRGIEKYLSSGRIKGIRKRFAKAIVERFGLETFHVIENFPELLVREIPYLGKERAYRASKFLKEQSLERDVTVFLASYEVSNLYVKKIIKAFGHAAIKTVSQDPYCLIEAIDGISFKTADRIAKAIGFADDDPRRLQAGVLFVMSQLVQEGDCYILYEQLLQSAAEVLNATPGKVEPAVRRNILIRKLVDDGGKIYLKDYYDAECYCADFLLRMMDASRFSQQRDYDAVVRHIIATIEHDQSIQYDDTQREAIYEALRNNLMILTGGPGTGKTTVLSAILQAMTCCNLRIAVCAPTGRAAKRAKESTGYDATTIHRMLSFSWEVNGFKFNEENHLEEDVIVIDEFSMVDILLFQSLLKAMTPYKRLIIVGDVDQLPSVGAGNVLKDMIDSHAIPVARLENIHRQQSDSRIPYAAQAVKHGRMPSLDNLGSHDFFFIEDKDDQSVMQQIVTLVSTRLPSAFGITSRDIQVLCPQRAKGTVNCTTLNTALQAALNPRGKSLSYGDTLFRTGDSVMQMKNNYEKGVYNGDIGYITAVDEELDYLTVSYLDRLVRYEEDDLDELCLAYATTIHKSQGSEYDTVIIPILRSSYIMLQRNLIYTAITRAKTRCILIGDRQAVFAAVTNLYVRNRRLFVDRQTALTQRLQQKV